MKEYITYGLVNRTRVTTSIDNKVLQQFEELAKETRINKSRLYDEALTDLLAKYGKPVKKKE